VREIVHSQKCETKRCKRERSTTDSVTGDRGDVPIEQMMKHCTISLPQKSYAGITGLPYDVEGHGAWTVIATNSMRWMLEGHYSHHSTTRYNSAYLCIQLISIQDNQYANAEGTYAAAAASLAVGSPSRSALEPAQKINWRQSTPKECQSLR
jgi:hypothetical protein